MAQRRIRPNFKISVFWRIGMALRAVRLYLILVATLGGHIVLIIGNGSKEKMLWIEASGIIAAMQNPERRIKWHPQPEMRGKSMRSNMLAHETSATVAIFIDPAFPIPATC